MGDEFADEEMMEDEEYDMDDKEFEELDPYDQGIIMEWKKAGRYSKKEEHISDDFDEK